MRILAVVGLVLLSSCASWTWVKKSAASPVTGQQRLMLAPPDWSGVMVDGDAEEKWLAGQDADWRKEWPEDKQNIATALESGIKARALHHVELVTLQNPDGATWVVRPLIREVDTGGYRPSTLVVRAQLVDPQGNVVEEIEAQGATRNVYTNFEHRIAECASEAGGNIGRYLADRTGK